VFDQTKIDPWFLAQVEDLLIDERELQGKSLKDLGRQEIYQLKRKGFSDQRLSVLLSCEESEVRQRRFDDGIHPVYKRVDSCAAEFSATTAYMYSTYEEECEAQPTKRDKIMVLGGGPNRIGQGIEFDYCCVHAAFACRDDGYETIMVNCNPETVSTDYDTSDRLYFEPLTLEDVLEILHVENPKGVIVQYGGQTPLKLARDLEAAGAPIIGTSPDSIDLAEDRERFQQMLHNANLKQPPNRTATSADGAVELANEIGYPLVVRPSYVLGGRAMEIVHNDDDLDRYMHEAVQVSNDSPVLLDHFLDHAIEVDVDAVSDGEEVIIAGIMQHIEQAGIHSGDSACSLPPYSLSEEIIEQIKVQTRVMAKDLKVLGLMNVQFAVQGSEIYVLEVNPRASRTVPFVSKATGIPFAKVAARCMTGISLAQQSIKEPAVFKHFAVKEAVFPFIKFPEVDPILGPEMKSTGEVMGAAREFGAAYAKAQLGAGNVLPEIGNALLSVRNADKEGAVGLARELIALGFNLVATHGTASVIQEAGLECLSVNKVQEGRPHIVDMIKNEQITCIINTTEGKQAIADSFEIRRNALQHKVYYTTTLAGGHATCMALKHVNHNEINRLQDIHKEIGNG
jgi:carbamoyl-phosphate synthase large subunit